MLLSKTKMDEVEGWQDIAFSTPNSAFNEGPPTLPNLPFPAKVETEGEWKETLYTRIYHKNGGVGRGEYLGLQRCQRGGFDSFQYQQHRHFQNHHRTYRKE